MTDVDYWDCIEADYDRRYGYHKEESTPLVFYAVIALITVLAFFLIQ